MASLMQLETCSCYKPSRKAEIHLSIPDIFLPDYDDQCTDMFDQGKWEERRWRRKQAPAKVELDGKVKEKKIKKENEEHAV